MNLPNKKERVFNDPPMPTKITFRRDIPATTYLRFKFHFIYPLIMDIVLFFELIRYATADTSGFGRTDMLLYLIVLVLIMNGLFLALRLTDFTVLPEMFERREVIEEKEKKP